MPSDVVRWDRLYAATLGIVDNVSVLAVRDGQLQPQPFGTPLIADATSRAYDFYGQDTWRIKPSLTITYGLAYGWQTPPHEKNGKQTFIVNTTNNNQILTADGYINAKLQAAQNGNAFNPTLGYLPIRKSGRSDIYNVDYGDIAPRVSGAWSPSYSSGFLGRIFGTGKSVVRAGFGIFYDRINNVESVEIPQLGVGFAQTLTLKSPLCNANSTAAVATQRNSIPRLDSLLTPGLPPSVSAWTAQFLHLLSLRSPRRSFRVRRSVRLSLSPSIRTSRSAAATASTSPFSENFPAIC